jgi:hypothetical protein
MSEKFRELLNVYTFTCELPGTGEEITFKPLTTAQIKNLLTYENERNPIIQDRAIDDVISKCVITPEFTVENIFLEDRFFLLLQIRKKSKGEVIEFKHDCDECGSQTLASVNLNDLPIIKRNPEENPIVEIDGGFTFKMRHVIRADYMHVDPKIFKGLSDSQASAEMQIIIYAVGIESITTEKYGEESDIPLEDKKFLLENIPTSEYEKVARWYDENNFGVDFNTSIRCVKCGHETDIVIPMDKAFFL